MTGERVQVAPKKLPFSNRKGIKRPGGLLINGFFDTVFYDSKNYQRHNRTRRSRLFHLEI